MYDGPTSELAPARPDASRRRPELPPRMPVAARPPLEPVAPDEAGPPPPSGPHHAAETEGQSLAFDLPGRRGGGDEIVPPRPKPTGDSRPRRPQRPGLESLRAALRVCSQGLFHVGAFSIAINLLMLTVPLYLFQISDRVLTSRSTDTLLMLSLIAVGALTLLCVLDALRRFVLTRVAMQTEALLGAPVMTAALRSADVSATRDIQALRDLQQVRSFVTGPVVLILFDAPMAPLYFAAVFFIHPTLGFIALVAGAILLFIAWVNEEMTAKDYGVASNHAMRATVQAAAQARNAQIISAMGMLEEAIQLWGRENAASMRAQVLASDRNIYLAGLSRYLRLLTQIAILGTGAYLALEAQVTGGMMIASSLIASRALAPAEGAIEGWRSFVQAKTSYDRIKTLLNSPVLEQERLILPKPEGRLTVERLLYIPPGTKRTVLNGVTFSLAPGDSLAVIGPSGGGKSTLARMLVGCILPTAGHVRLDYMDLRNWDRRQLGESIGYLPQDIELFPGTIKANIARMREDATDESIARAAALAGVHEMISQFTDGYETEIAVDGSPLSGGQKQQIALARAFFGDPRLIVLDEPNANLDTVGERALATALARARAQGITVVLVTQRPAVLQSVDKILVLRQGVVAAFGEREQILPRLTGQREDELGIGTASRARSPATTPGGL
ncbi:type I secretion system permease/ATPase [Chelatococcus sp. SYSU_G07232]|uniref:Type I secretion system permease/ATPase n=1 Tax=Chelatococcus albus TaxID=3047466 RepID=A0ABT7AEB9_9HYPH|nr:type I secretion system permease/ATPase [Chelatococcus sp. SYSU_G07232]MDJ1157716.1 type I secretion system permease/ATPase [Chelatococcus sp. SYSU_G07232]